MQHFVCTGGCGGQSDVEGTVCEARFCKKEGELFTECNCDDGLHNMADAEVIEDDYEAELAE